MKNTFFLIATCSLLLAACGGGAKKIEGSVITLNLKNMPAQEIRLMTWDGANIQPVALDTVAYQGDDRQVKLYTGPLTEQAYLEINFAKNKNGFIPLALTSETVTITGDYNDMKNIQVRGSDATVEMLAFLKGLNEKNMQLSGMQNEMDSLARAKAPDTVLKAKEKILLDAVNQALEEKRQFIATTKNPVNAVLGLQTLMTRDERRAFKPLVDSFSQRFPGSAFIQRSQKRFYEIISDSPNSNPSLPSPAAKEISLPDVNGNIVTLSSMKGKWVLIDFWASWCGPCRQENPNVVVAYNKFKNKNFTILGVSLDRNKADWVQAIKDDGLTWTQVSDLKFWDCKAARDYGVQGIPMNYLVDPQGNVVASNLRGAALEEELTKRLK